MSNQKEDSSQDTDRWLISYADYTTLLFAFFVVLYATSEMNLSKVKILEESLREQFLGSKLTGGGISNNKKISDSPLSPPIQTFSWRKTKGAKTLKDIEIYMESKISEKDIKKKIHQVGQEELGVRVSLSSLSLFEPQSAELSQEGLGVLAKIGEWIRRKKYKILIESHVDASISLSQSRSFSHRDLTAARSSVIVQHLIQNEGIPSFRLIGLSYGRSKPIVLNGSPALRSKNNRTDFLILTEDSPF